MAIHRSRQSGQIIPTFERREHTPTGMTLGQWVERVSELDDNRA